jgi:hypothetical protein
MPHEFNARDADVRSTAFPALVRANGTTIPVSGYAFDATAEEAVFFRFRASDYVSGNVTVDLDWYADTASSGAVVWGAQMAAITPDTDSQDIETDALPTTTNVTDTHLGTVGQRLHRASVTLTGAALDTVAANDHVAVRVARVSTDGADTMTGDAILVHVSVSA